MAWLYVGIMKGGGVLGTKFTFLKKVIKQNDPYEIITEE